jgi:hypothetical protein
VAARVCRHDPGAEVRSVSWRSTVAPGSIPLSTLATMEAGVEVADQSRPQAVHRTVLNPCRRAARTPSPVSHPYGGR